jgi:DNA-binding NarL/FixJ family response regulator
MSDRPLKVLLIDQDPIFRLGLRVALEQVPNLEVTAEAQTDTVALHILAEFAKKDPKAVNLVILELGNSRYLQLCRQLKAEYPNLPILLLSSVSEPGLLMAARDAGVDGYCPKGTPVSELVDAMQLLASGGSYWDGVGESGREGEGGSGRKITPNSSLSYRRSDGTSLPHSSLSYRRSDGTSLPHSSLSYRRSDGTSLPPSSPQHFARLRNDLRLSGIDYINATLAKVTAQLQVPGLPLLDRAILAGQRRELLAAGWLVNRLLATPQERQNDQMTALAAAQDSPANPSLNSAVVISPIKQNYPSLLSPRALQATLFSSCVAKLQLPLQNLGDEPLEIDIFRQNKKRELLYLILQKLANSLDEVRSSQIEVNQLYEFKNIILCDLWQASITDFFGKFTKVQVGNQNLEIVTFLLQAAKVVETEIINKIPLVGELFSYLLFQTDLSIDNTIYSAGSVEAMEQSLMILENLLIQVANGVVQPLLNTLADVEKIKQSFYDRQFISTREIERFRNDLSWKYRLRNYVSEAQAIFESRYELLVFTPRGIAKISIYAPRNQELAQLSGIPLLVTLALEFRDAIAPRLKSLLSFAGSGIVFVLTQVIGRGLGLIGRGILQGIGSAKLPERNLRGNDDRPK